MVWQLDNQTVDANGEWDRLGARELLVQWTVVDDTAFVDKVGVPVAPKLPDWKRIGQQRWAQDVIVGLAGRFDEAAARADMAGLAEISERIARLSLPLNVVGWYFPVEIDPTWDGAANLKAVLDRLPRPLWVSAYDSANVGPNELAAKLDACLPPDVGVFFQDGVGVHARTPAVARQYADVLSTRLGNKRVKMIAEAFRPANTAGHFRPATADEIRTQLKAYSGYSIYLFDGPHYVPAETVDALVH